MKGSNWSQSSSSSWKTNGSGTLPAPLPPTFIDQCNALRSNTTVLNVPWKRSDHFLNLNLF